jgi:hypothetical protein
MVHECGIYLYNKQYYDLGVSENRAHPQICIFYEEHRNIMIIHLIRGTPFLGPRLLSEKVRSLGFQIPLASLP